MSLEENILLKAEKDHLAQLCEDMLEKTADYLNGEVAGVVEDYRLLEKLNVETLKKYTEMKEISGGISSAVEKLNNKYTDLQPYLEMIDHLDENITSLELAAHKVDLYSKRLESKFKQLENS